MSDSVGSVSVEVVPDARGWAEKLRAQIRDQTVHAKVDMDTAEAETKLDELIVKEDDAGRTRHGKIDIDTNKVAQATSKLDGFLGKLGLLPALALTAGAGLVPLVGVLGGVVAALAAPIAFAGGGLTLFGILAGFAVKDTNAQLKQIASLQTKLDGLTKGTAEYAQVQKQLADAQRSLSPEQEKFANGISKVKAAFQTFLAGPAGDALLEPLVQGMNVLVKLIPSLTPMVVSVSHALGTLLSQFARYASSPGFALFIHQIAHQMGPDILAFGHIVGNIAAGLGPLLVMLGRSHFSHELLSGLEGMTRNFADFARSSGRKDLHDLLAYAAQQGPTVARTLGNVAHALERIVQALAPLGPPVLHVISGIAAVLSKIPVPVLTGLAGAAAGLVALQKVGGLKLAGAIAGRTALGGGGVKGTVGGLLTGGIQKVYVVNMPGSGLPGGGDGLFGKVGKYLGYGGGAGAEAGLSASAAAAGAALGAIALTAYIGYIQRNIHPYGTHAGNDPNVARGGVAAAKKYGTYQPPTSTPSIPGGAYAARGGQAALNFYSASAAAQDQAHLQATTTKLDGLRAASDKASANLELIGPHTAGATRTAEAALSNLQSRLNALHDKKIAVILNDQAAIDKMQALQNMQIRDKSYNIITNVIERHVGPGGGIGRHATGGLITGPGTGTSDSILARLSRGEYVVRASAVPQNRALLDQINYGSHAASFAAGVAASSGSGPARFTLQLDRRGQHTLTGYMDSHYNANRDADARFGRMRRGG